MRRKTRKAVIHFTLFGIVLCLILFTNRPQLNKTFAWNEIRYKTTSTTLPKAHGICPGLENNSKPVLVVSRIEADGDWLDALTEKYHLCPYTVDKPLGQKSPGYLQVPANRGHEAMAYLTFLTDNYENLPEAVVFIHGSRWAWHNDAPDYDNLALLLSLNIPRALEPWGYHNLRCDWSLSSCPPSEPPQGSLETSMQAVLEPWDARAVSDAALPHALASLFGGNKDASNIDDVGVLLGRDDAVRSQCCAQFVVSRDKLLEHSRGEYVAIRQWLLDGNSASDDNGHLRSIRNAAPHDDRVAGRILSYVWHILFLKRESNGQDLTNHIDLERLNNLACPRADDCYCRLYGRCNLEHCTSPGSCYGQYRLPPNLKLPEDWAATHS